LAPLSSTPFRHASNKHPNCSALPDLRQPRPDSFHPKCTGHRTMERDLVMGKLRILGLVCLATAAFAGTPEYDRAHELYQRTEYKQALDVLNPVASKSVEALQLSGQSYFMLGDYRKALDSFEKAITLGPPNSEKAAELYHWMGRTYGRRAETGTL